MIARILTAGIIGVVLAVASGADGAWPRAGRPAVVLPGGTISLGGDLEAPVALRRGETQLPLDLTAGESPPGPATGMAPLPPSATAGGYDLVYSEAGAKRVNVGAVFVVPPDLNAYRWAAIRAEVDDGTPTFSDALMARVAAAEPDLLFVLGGLTPAGGAEAYTRLSARFAQLPMPVFFCPDAAELNRGGYEAVFGPRDFGFRFGPDGYLMIGGGLWHRDARSAERIGPLHRWRRELRSSRWSVGVAARFGLDWSMRAQLALLVDNPLDYLITAPPADGGAQRVPWGQTAFALPVSDPDSTLHVIEVDMQGFRPGATVPISAELGADDGAE